MIENPFNRNVCFDRDLPSLLALPNKVWNPKTSSIAWVYSTFTASTAISWIRSQNSTRKKLGGLWALGKSLESTSTRDEVGYLWPYLNTTVTRLVVLFICSWLAVVLLQNSLKLVIWVSAKRTQWIFQEDHRQPTADKQALWWSLWGQLNCISWQQKLV